MINIKKLRSEKGLTQEEFSKILGVSRITVINIESHKYSTLKRSVEKKICEYFGITPFVLYGTDNLRYRPSTEEELNSLIEGLKEEFANGKN